MLRKIIVETIVALFIILFIYTGINKIIDYSNFETQLGRSPFIQNISILIAKTLPAGELLLALLLILKRTRLLGLYLSFSIMAMFSGYIYIMLNYAYDLPCSCGGVLKELSWQNHLIFNIVFTILALIGIITQSKLKQTAPKMNKVSVQN